MGEIAALSRAFDIEFNKHYEALPRLAHDPDHDAFLNHYRQVQRIAESIAYYASRLPPYASVHRILAFGDRLAQRGEHRLALEACYTYVKNLNIHMRNVVRAHELTCLSWHVQACYGVAVCEATLVLHHDPQMKHPDTLAAVVACLHQLKDVLVLVLPSEQLYWITLNGTLHIYSLAKRLLTAGFVAQMLPFLVFCVKALESHVIFSTSKYLTWRTQLYISLCYAYCDVREHGMAKQVVQEGLSKIDALIKLQKLDPVPAPPDVQAAYRTAKATLCALMLKLEVICAPTPGTGLPTIPDKPAPAAKAGAGKGHGPRKSVTGEKARDKSLGGTNELISAAWQPLLVEVGDTPKARLTAMLEAMQVPGKRVVRHAPVEGALKDMFELARFEAAPLVKTLMEALKEHQKQLEEQQQQQQQQQLGEQHEGSTGAHTGEGVSSHAGRPSSASSLHSKLASEGGHPHYPHHHHPHHPHHHHHHHHLHHHGHAPHGHATHGHPQLPHLMLPEAEEFSLLLHTALLCTAYNFEQGDAVEELLELARLRLTHGAVGSVDDSQVAVFSAVTALLRALQQLSTAPGTDSLHQLSKTLASIHSVAARAVTDMLTDAALVLYAEAKPLLNGVYCKRDREAGLVMGILRTLHVCFEAVDLDDAVLRLSVSLKLAHLLAEPSQQDSGGTEQLHEARDVLRSTRIVVERFRCEAALMMRGQPNEHLHWITASRNQPSDAVAKLVAGMPDTDQELACLHVDILATLYRVELAVGVAEQQAQALFQQAQLAENVKRREAQSSIFGVRTMKERRLDEQRILQAATTSSNPALKERELLQACGKNPYEKALALTAMAPLQAEPHRQLALLNEAASCLTKAQEQEDALFAAAQPEQKGKASGPLQPKILHRTPTSCTLTHFPFNLKGSKRVAKYAVYAKVFGAGVALILNKTASEYPGTGTMVLPGTPIMVEGLRTNDTYVFALAVYDDTGALIGELGTSSVETLVGLPLPLYHCWGHLLLMACRLRLWPIANHAANVLLPHFITTGPDRPLWEANPMDAQVINKPHVEVATRALLRIFVQAVYAHTGAGMSKHDALATPPALRSTSPPPPLADIRMSYAHEQVARLKSVKRLLLAVKVAVVLHDEMLIQEGAVRVYHMLGPLLVLKAKIPMIHKALAKTHICLQDIANLVQMSQTGQEALRLTAARVSSAVVYHAVMMATAAREEGSVKFFARLDVELMKAYDPRFSVPGRPPMMELPGESAALQELLLSHDRAPEFAEAGGGVIADRMKDKDDVVAGALPYLAQANPMDVWNHLGRLEVVDHPRWVELMVRAMEASVRKGRLENVEALAGQVMWHVRSKLQCPPAAAYPYEPKWQLEAAAAELTDVELEPNEEPPKPDLTSLLDVNTAAEEEAWLAAREAVLMQARRRHAAAILLQRRLPLLLARLKAIREVRQAARRWAPWMARLQTVLGLAKTQEARACVEALMQVKDLPADTAESPAQDPASDAPDADPAARALPAAAQQKPPKPAPSKGKEAKGSAAAAATTGGSAVAAPLPTSKAALKATPLQALAHLARGVQLAVRGEAWHEALNAVRHLWNSTRALVNAAPLLLEPTPTLQWELGEMPPVTQPPESLLVAPKEAKGAKGGKKEDAGKAKPGGKGGKVGGKSAAVDAPPEPSWPPVPLPQNAQDNNVARTLRAVVEGLLTLVGTVKAGTPLNAGVIPLGEPPRNSPPLGPEPSTAGTHRPGSALSTAYASSNFSFGSDVVAELWFRKTPLDMDWINKFIIMALQVLLKMNRFYTIIQLGTAWLSLCEGYYNEKLLPILINAAPLAGLDDAPFKAAMEVVMRDKNQALDSLDKVRLLVRERLGEVTLLNHHIGTKIRKKRKARPHQPHRGPARANSLIEGSEDQQALSDQASGVTAYTYKTQSSVHSQGAQPDFIAIPLEYERVIEQLKKRSEKAAMILAIAELGDVHAHFGNWGGATTAWNDALDTLLGPYQVIRHWRKLLDHQTKEQVLQQYGVHGCLLAGAVLVGKLSRYSYFSSTGQRLEVARLGATLLAPLFTASIAHPQRLVGFATYVPRVVWDGVDLFSDAYKCNITDLQSGLEGIASMLVEAGLLLEALPVISLWEHVTLHIARNLKATVLCRLMRTRALVQLGLMSEASCVLIDLMRGARLPDATLDTDYVVKNDDGSVLQVPLVPPLSNSLYPGDPANRPALSFIGEGPLPAVVEKLYGSWAAAHLALARAEWLTRLGATPNLWKACHPTTGREVTPAKPLPDNLEPQLLEWASALIERALAMARGKPLPPEVGREATTAAPAKSAKGGSKASSTGEKKKEDKKAAAAAAAAPPSPSAQNMAAAAAEPSHFLQEAQRADVMVPALLCASKVALLQWQPLRALHRAMEATRFMGSREEEPTSGGPVLDENDEVDRLTLRASLWMAARLQTVQCLVRLGHARPCYALVATALKEAEQAKDGLAAVQLLHAKGHMQELEGQTADALNTYNDVIARYQALGLRCDLRAAEALSDAAGLRDRLGLRQDSLRLGQAAFNMLEAWVRGMGLEESKEHPELINIYTDGTSMYIRALQHMGRCCARARDHRGAAQHFAHAFSLLRVHTRALPCQHAAAALALGRALRHVVLLEPLTLGDLPPPLLPLQPTPRPAAAVPLPDAPPAPAPPPPTTGGGRKPSPTRAQSPAQKAAAAAAAAEGVQSGGVQHQGVGSSPFTGAVAAAIASGAAPGVASPSAPWLRLAQDVLHQALVLAALDGGHQRQIMRAALLELASLYMACALPRCGAACLAHADAVSSKADTLMLANHLLIPVAVDKLPEWAKEFVRGQEDAFLAQQDKQAPSTPALADADLGRMLVCHFLSLMRGAPSLPAGEAVCAEAQITVLHTALLSACPKYASDACFASVPLPPIIHEAAPQLAPGRVILQWYPQDGCWQSDRSWQTGGTLGLSHHVTHSDVLNLQPVEQYASLLFAVANQSGVVRTGELTFEVAAVRSIQRRVKELRHRCEFPKAPTDLFGYDAPSAKELAAIRQASERFLGLRRLSEDGAGWGDSPLQTPQASEQLDAPTTPGQGAGVETAGQPTPPPQRAAAPAGGRGLGPRAAAAVAKPEPVGPPPTDLNFLIKLEALLAMEGGLDLVDPSLAEWLFMVLPSDALS